jgi:orotate phosphoribosyltransferase
MSHCYVEPDLRIERAKLIDDLKQFSIKKGEEFTLASGQKSNVYIDVKQTMSYGPAMHNLAKLLCYHASVLGRYDAVAGVPLGGSHLATMLAMYNAPCHTILVRKEAKDHGTQQLVEAPTMDSKRVVLVEDVVTTGQSSIKAAKILEDSGFDIRGIVSVVDRRAEKSLYLGDYLFIALVDFQELIED